MLTYAPYAFFCVRFVSQFGYTYTHILISSEEVKSFDFQGFNEHVEIRLRSLLPGDTDSVSVLRVNGNIESDHQINILFFDAEQTHVNFDGVQRRAIVFRDCLETLKENWGWCMFVPAGRWYNRRRCINSIDDRLFCRVVMRQRIEVESVDMRDKNDKRQQTSYFIASSSCWGPTICNISTIMLTQESGYMNTS